MSKQSDTQELFLKKQLRSQAVLAELNELEQILKELTIQYEQHFLGILERAPEKLHRQVKLRMKSIRRMPLKNTRLRHRIQTVERRYSTYNSYWQRTMRERESGTYKRDLFKAQLHEQIAREEKHAKTRKGAAEKQLEELYTSYTNALEGSGQRGLNLDYNDFKRTLVRHARQLKKSGGSGQVGFKIVVKDGRVKIQGYKR